MRSDSALNAFAPIADALAARGIRRVVGRVVAEGDAFPGTPLGFGWAWDDLDFGYSAGADELMFNENFFRVIARGGTTVGARATAQLLPDVGFPELHVAATTRARDDSITADTAPLAAAYDSVASQLRITGTVRLGDSTVISRAYRQPNDAVRAAIRTSLASRGIRFTAGAAAPALARTDTLVVLTSLPLRDVHLRMQKPSQNQIAETLFKTIALEQTGVGSADSARAAVERQLELWGITQAEAAVRDGSGLSRHDYVSPRAIVRLLTVMQSHPSFDAFYSALPVAGVDGTIASRMRGTPAAGNLRAKTGFVDKARSLSGYVNTADGHQLVFSILANNWVGSVRDVERVQDAIGAYLASVRMADMRVAMPR
jgi:D-alanyl-D-alanine carboxypeptidase/D-alanyl-D-alanine-endopeptidase (penicillin-binding protein 4)